MSTLGNHPSAFSDGKKELLPLFDYLFQEVSAEIARRHKVKEQPVPIGDTTGDSNLLSSCMQILTHPTILHRLQRLEKRLSKFWIDPLSFCDLPPMVTAELSRRTVVFRPPASGTIVSGPLNDSRCAMNRARVSIGTTKAVLPVIPSEFSNFPHRARLPVGTQVIQQGDPGHLGHLGTMRILEETS